VTADIRLHFRSSPALREGVEIKLDAGAVVEFSTRSPVYVVVNVFTCVRDQTTRDELTGVRRSITALSADVVLSYVVEARVQVQLMHHFVEDYEREAKRTPYAFEVHSRSIQQLPGLLAEKNATEYNVVGYAVDCAMSATVDPERNARAFAPPSVAEARRNPVHDEESARQELRRERSKPENWGWRRRPVDLNRRGVDSGCVAEVPVGFL
jgi:hypothetical protein